MEWSTKNFVSTSNPRAQGKGLTRFWRYRVGAYRIIADIRNEEVIILSLTIGHRKEVYK